MDGGRFLLEPSPGTVRPDPGKPDDEVDLHLAGITPCDGNKVSG